MATTTRQPNKSIKPRPQKRATRHEMVLHLRELLVHAARALAEELRPEWASEAVVTVELREGSGHAAIRFPSRRE
jgi:hypothetical protein